MRLVASSRKAAARKGKIWWRARDPADDIMAQDGQAAGECPHDHHSYGQHDQSIAQFIAQPKTQPTAQPLVHHSIQPIARHTLQPHFLITAIERKLCSLFSPCFEHMFSMACRIRAWSGHRTCSFPGESPTSFFWDQRKHGSLAFSPPHAGQFCLGCALLPLARRLGGPGQGAAPCR